MSTTRKQDALGLVQAVAIGVGGIAIGLVPLALVRARVAPPTC